MRWWLWCAGVRAATEQSIVEALQTCVFLQPFVSMCVASLARTDPTALPRPSAALWTSAAAMFTVAAPGDEPACSQEVRGCVPALTFLTALARETGSCRCSTAD